MTAKKANIRDVAKTAGVSITTTSQILKGVGRYSDATIKKVWQVVNELNYTPNPYAKKIFAKEKAVREETRLLMRVTHCPFDHYIFNDKGHEPLRMFYFEQACQDHGYAGTNYTYRHTVGFQSHLLLNDMIDGVILGSGTKTIIENLRSRLPVVLSDINVAPEKVGLPVVNTDFSAGYSHALQILQKSGYKGKMAVIYGCNEVTNTRSVLDKRDIAYDLITAAEMNDIRIEKRHEIEWEIDPDNNQKRMNELADRIAEMVRYEKVRIIGMQGVGDPVKLKEDLLKRGIHLPDDAVLLCVHNMPLSERGIAALTYDWEKMMTSAVTVLLRQIKEKENTPNKYLVPCAPFNDEFLA